jgi:hypothetical protein
MTEASVPPYDTAASPRADAQSLAGVRVIRCCIVFVFLATTVLARFGVNVGGQSLPVSLAALYVLLAALALAKHTRVDGTTTAIYGCVLLAAYVSWFINSSYASVDRSSPSSLIFLIALYLPFTVILRTSDDTDSEWRWTARAFGTIAMLCALAGIAQFFAQFVIKAPWLIDFRPLLPDAIRNIGTYNTSIPVGDLYKSNGFFLREPSAFSFLMALAAIVEMNTDRRWRRVAIFIFALLLTYSGTGVLALLIGLLFPLGRNTIVRLVALVVGGGLLIALLGDTLNLSFTVNRVQEFGSEHSSAYIRYIAPMHVIAGAIDASPWSALFGHGSGSIQRTAQTFQAFDPTWAKLLFEYGLFGCAAMLALVLHALSQSRVPTQIAAVLFFSWLIMGGHLLSPDNISMLYVLACMWRRNPIASKAQAIASPGTAVSVTGGAT